MADNVNARFAVNLRAARQARGLTLTELGAKAGVTHGAIWRIEKGRCGPSLTVADALARALDTTVTAMTQAPEGRRD